MPPRGQSTALQELLIQVKINPRANHELRPKVSVFQLTILGLPLPSFQPVQFTIKKSYHADRATFDHQTTLEAMFPALELTQGP